MNNDNVNTWEVKEGEEMRLLTYLLRAMPQRSRTDIKRLLGTEHVAVNGRATRQWDTALKAGDKVQVSDGEAFTGGGPDDRLQIIYEDDDLIVVNKAAGLLSVGADNQRRRSREEAGQETAYSLMRAYVKHRNRRNELYILHRLDRDTSGVLAFAKNEAVQKALRDNWNNLVKVRQYQAVVSGTLKPAEGVVRSYLAENAKYDVFSIPDPTQGRLAITSYRTLANGNGYTLAEMLLSTGRKNQIRVHMHDLGHPVVGDPRYGGAASPIGRMCLHASRLSLINPLTHRVLTFDAPAPEAFAAMVYGRDHGAP